jgi:hypothetical protein
LVRRLFANLDGVKSPKSFPSTSALWVVHTSLTMTPWTHDARNFAGLEQSRTSQRPSLTGSKYGSGFLFAIEDSPIHFAVSRPALSNWLGVRLMSLTIDTTASKTRVVLDLPLAYLVAQGRRLRRAAA